MTIVHTVTFACEGLPEIGERAFLNVCFPEEDDGDIKFVGSVDLDSAPYLAVRITPAEIAAAAAAAKEGKRSSSLQVALSISESLDAMWRGIGLPKNYRPATDEERKAFGWDQEGNIERAIDQTAPLPDTLVPVLCISTNESGTHRTLYPVGTNADELIHDYNSSNGLPTYREGVGVAMVTPSQAAEVRARGKMSFSDSDDFDAWRFGDANEIRPTDTATREKPKQWFRVRDSFGGEHIVTLPDRRDDPNALAARGLVLEPPFMVLGPATDQEAVMAENEFELRSCEQGLVL
jgi:hypothetical protein